MFRSKMLRLQEEPELKMVIRLNQYTTEYKALEKEKEEFYKSHINDMSRTTIQTLYLQQQYIDSIIKRIVMLVDNLIANEIDFDNECATLVYNYYMPYIRRGFDILL